MVAIPYMNFDTVQNRMHGYDVARHYFEYGIGHVAYLPAYPYTDGNRIVSIDHVRQNSTESYQLGLAQQALIRAQKSEDPAAVYSAIGWCVLKALCAGLDMRAKGKGWKQLGTKPDELKHLALIATQQGMRATADRAVMATLASVNRTDDLQDIAHELHQWAFDHAVIAGRDPHLTDAYQEMNMLKRILDDRLLSACFHNPDVTMTYLTALCRTFKIDTTRVHAVFDTLPEHRKAHMHARNLNRPDSASARFNLVQQIQRPVTNAPKSARRATMKYFLTIPQIS